MNEPTAWVIVAMGFFAVIAIGIICMTVLECKGLDALKGNDSEDESEKPEWEHSREL